MLFVLLFLFLEDLRDHVSVQRVCKAYHPVWNKGSDLLRGQDQQRCAKQPEPWAAEAEGSYVSRRPEAVPHGRGHANAIQVREESDSDLLKY